MKPEGRGRIRWQGRLADRGKHAYQAAFFTRLGCEVCCSTCSNEAEEAMHSPMPLLVVLITEFSDDAGPGFRTMMGQLFRFMLGQAFRTMLGQWEAHYWHCEG